MTLGLSFSLWDCVKVLDLSTYSDPESQLHAVMVLLTETSSRSPDSSASRSKSDWSSLMMRRYGSAKLARRTVLSSSVSSS